MFIKHRSVAAAAVCLLFYAFIIHLVTAKPFNDTVQTIKGYVIAVEWNDDEEVVAIAIRLNDVSEEEEDVLNMPEDYRVVENEKAIELMEFIDEMVEATGTIKTDEIGNKSILVNSYRIIDEEEEEEYIGPETEPNK